MGEGDDFFFIDGEEEPSLRGTGTEDYFCDAWGFRESDGPFYGVNVYEGYEIQDRTTVYRWHIPDPVPFKKSLRLEMEHWGWWWVKDKDGKDIIDDGTRADDWSTVAYWYQIGPHRPYEKMPVGYDRLYYDWTHIVEAESLKGKASVDKGTIDQWGGTFASGHGYLHWSANEPGGTFEIPFMVEKPGEYCGAEPLLPGTDTFIGVQTSPAELLRFPSWSKNQANIPWCWLCSDNLILEPSSF